MNTRHYSAHDHAPDHHTIRTHAASWRMFRRMYSKAVHMQMRDDAIAMSQECDRLHTMHQRTAIEQHGPIRTLVSGGICEHWPRPVKDTIGNLARLANTWDDIARDHHKAAGLRSSTFGRTEAPRPRTNDRGWYDGNVTPFHPATA